MVPMHPYQPTLVSQGFESREVRGPNAQQFLSGDGPLSQHQHLAAVQGSVQV